MQQLKNAVVHDVLAAFFVYDVLAVNNYLVSVKHRVMENKEAIVQEVLLDPDTIRKSKIDENVFLYYKLKDKLYCVIVKHEDDTGFLITAYPTDKVKEGEIVWTRS